MNIDQPRSLVYITIYFSSCILTVGFLFLLKKRSLESLALISRNSIIVCISTQVTWDRVFPLTCTSSAFLL